MSLSLSIHSIVRLTLASHVRKQSSWIDFVATDFQGNHTNFHIFFEDEVYMRKLAHAINQVNAETAKEFGPYPNCRHPDQCPGYCTRDPACSE